MTFRKIQKNIEENGKMNYNADNQNNEYNDVIGRSNKWRCQFI